MPGRGGPGGRSAYFESVLKMAPILVGVLFLVVAVALLRNFIEDRFQPDTGQEKFDPVRDFSKVNSRGMMAVAMQKPQTHENDWQASEE